MYPIPPQAATGTEGRSKRAAYYDGRCRVRGEQYLHREQYFELNGNQAYYKDGWLANILPPHPSWVHVPTNDAPEDYEWQLYDLNTDYSQSGNIAAKFPGKLAELKADFDKAADKFYVKPMRGDFFGRMDPSLRPSILNWRTSATCYPGPERHPPGAFLSMGRNAWNAKAFINVQNVGIHCS